MKVCPEMHDNDWINDAASLWYSIDLLKVYLEDIIYDKEVCTTPPIYAFDNIVAVGLEEAEGILRERIKELEESSG